jgi:hypothetical protein
MLRSKKGLKFFYAVKKFNTLQVSLRQVWLQVKINLLLQSHEEEDDTHHLDYNEHKLCRAALYAI